MIARRCETARSPSSPSPCEGVSFALLPPDRGEVGRGVRTDTRSRTGWLRVGYGPVMVRSRPMIARGR